MEIVGFLLILLFTVLNCGESMAVKAYAKRYGSGGMLMNAVIALFAALFILISDLVEGGGFYVPLAMLPYAAINCLLFASGFYFGFLAYKTGPYGLTRLISSFSLLFTIFYGLFFLKEKATYLTYIGIAMIFAAMVLINYKSLMRKPKAAPTDEEAAAPAEDAENGVSLKWLFFLMISLVSNGFIGILMKMQQNRFEGACDNEFQVLSIGGSFVLLAVLGLIVDRDKLRTVAKNGMLYGAISGLFNGAKNLVTLLIYAILPLSTVSPIKTGLGMVSAFILSLTFYKEKYSVLQIVGVALGAGAVVLLAL